MYTLSLHINVQPDNALIKTEIYTGVYGFYKENLCLTDISF